MRQQPNTIPIKIFYSIAWETQEHDEKKIDLWFVDRIPLCALFFVLLDFNFWVTFLLAFTDSFAAVNVDFIIVYLRSREVFVVALFPSTFLPFGFILCLIVFNFFLVLFVIIVAIVGLGDADGSKLGQNPKTLMSMNFKFISWTNMFGMIKLYFIMVLKFWIFNYWFKSLRWMKLLFVFCFFVFIFSVVHDQHSAGLECDLPVTKMCNGLSQKCGSSFYYCLLLHPDRRISSLLLHFVSYLLNGLPNLIYRTSSIVLAILLYVQCTKKVL